MIVFASIEEAIEANALPVVLYVRIGGEAVDATEARVLFGVDTPVGTCTVYVQAPRPAVATMNATIEIEMGYPGASARRFMGFIPSDESVTDDQGASVRIEGVDYASWLGWPEYAGIEIPAPVSLKEVFRSFCALRGIPASQSDETTAVDGITPIMLGGNPNVDDGMVRLDNNTAPLDWVQRVPPVYGYRVFGCPDGEVRQARISGLAVAEPGRRPVVFREGVNCFSVARERSIREMANYIEVKGARFTADDGGPAAIRAIPENVPWAEELAPQGWRKYTVSLQDIVTDEQAQWVRTATEVNRSAPYELLTWEAPARSDLQPGDVVTVDAPTHDVVMTDYWLMSIDESVSDRGYIGRYTGWRGAGRALPAGNDCRTETLYAGTIHMGTETLGHYRHPAPMSIKDKEDTNKKQPRRIYPIDFTVTDADYSSLRLGGRCHGTNSIGTSTAITGSVVEIWQFPDPSKPASGTNELRRVGAMELPTVDEEVKRKRNYADDRYWTEFSLPLPGALKVGPATMVLVCGVSKDGEIDDYEVAGLRLTYCGVGEPILPGQVAT